MFVCLCNQITDRQISNAIAGGATTIDALKDELGVGSNCGGCLSFATSQLNDTLTKLLDAPSDQFYAA